MTLMPRPLNHFAAEAVPRGKTDCVTFRPVQAPWIRPGVVVHDPDETVDDLLGEFALELRTRGFNVIGYIQRNQRRCSGQSDGCAQRVDYIDLSSGQPLTIERSAATSYLRRAMREDGDLLVISRFAACIEATDTLKPLIGDGLAGGLPMLTSIAGQCIHKWHSYARLDGAMVAPDLASLWAWWGPERLYADLALGVAEEPVSRIVCGQRWLMVEGPRGVGLAPLPRHPRDLLPRLPRLMRESLRSLAGLTASWEPLELALGIAALNAHYNRFDLDGRTGNGMRSFYRHSGRRNPGRMVAIGAFPGIDGILPGCAVIESDPKPGEFPPSAMDSLLPGCGGVVVNASALVARSLPRILRLTRNRPAALIGPATPLTPRLHAYGIGLLGGFVARDPDGLAMAIRAGALPREFGRFGRYIHLDETAPAAG